MSGADGPAAVAPALRPATVDDVPAVLAFWRAAAEDRHRPADTAAALGALLARDPDALILAWAGVELVGTVIAGWDGWRCRLYRLAVAPGYRGRGLARTLVEAAEQRFRAFGGTRVDALVLDDNTLAEPAWRAFGYEPRPEWARWSRSLSAD
ncbi:GNAT family N-acetyltransferase [Plantactinospora sp. B5E13]|uniref:GNAT family N-acetyltransferase n=1 Tax=Plantactinospora sp. B5E13 TaxID=3153758 RepID=UPI00325CE93C